MNTTCAHCGELFDINGLRNDSWTYLAGDTQGVPDRIWMRWLTAGDPTANPPHATDSRNAVSTWVYRAVLSGRGCPDCGFAHTDTGEHRITQLRELVQDTVTDDNPMQFE